MKGQTIIAGNSIATQPTNKAAAAGPIKVTKYDNGYPVSTTTLPAPGAKYDAPAEKMNKRQQKAKNSTFTSAGQALNEAYQSKKGAKP